MNIGVFDSGLGGLTIFKELLKGLPQYNYLYLGDNARVPYGGRSPQVIYEFTRQAVDFLFKKDCQLIILACNTATANALRRIQHEYLPKHYPHRRVLGIIRPSIEAVTESDAKKVGVIATWATVSSQSFVKEIKKINSDIEVLQQAGPLLVPFIEEGETNGPILERVLRRYLHPLIQENIDSLILGCTHYGLIKKTVKKITGPKIKIVTEGEIVAAKLKDYLKRHPAIAKKLGKSRGRQYFITDYSPRYRQLVKLFLGSQFGDGLRLKLIKLGANVV